MGLVDCFLIAWSGVVVTRLTGSVVLILDFYGQRGFSAILKSRLGRVKLCIRCGVGDPSAILRSELGLGLGLGLGL